MIESVQGRASSFSTVVLLAAEVTWHERQPRVIRVPIPWKALPSPPATVGLALRIGPFGGPFARDDDRAGLLASLAASLAKEAAENGVGVRELQIDFDCAESKLEGYLAWVTAIRGRVPSTPLVITALPGWLGHPAFEKLARSVDGYVLQVHSLERPASPDAPFTLCDPGLARKAVARAGQLGSPFRVALPTYGYLLGFDRKGNFAGLSAEGPLRKWGMETQLREVRSDPAELAGLVREWEANHPETMRGVIWYRLPVEGDALNWSWPTLARVMRGEAPKPGLRVEVRRTQAGLVEFDLVNAGDADYVGNPEVEAKWTGGRPVASDGLRGFQPCATDTNTVVFRAARSSRIRPQERRMIGWLRLSGDTTVETGLRENTNETGG